MPGDDIRDHVPDDEQSAFGEAASVSSLATAGLDAPGRVAHAPAQAAAIRPARRTLPRTAARLAASEAPSVCRTR